MTATLHRFRPLLIGLVVLLLTAGIAFAATPSAPPAGLDVATEASGAAMPVQAVKQDEDDEDDEDEEAGDAQTAPQGATEPVVVTVPVAGAEDVQADGEGIENCSTDPTGLSDEALAELTHGSIVCWAAHQETPDGYDNHGAWVSEWARKNHGHADQTVEGSSAAVPAEDGSGNGHGNGGNGKADKP